MSYTVGICTGVLKHRYLAAECCRVCVYSVPGSWPECYLLLLSALIYVGLMNAQCHVLAMVPISSETDRGGEVGVWQLTPPPPLTLLSNRF